MTKMHTCSRMPTTSTEARKSLSVSHGVSWVINGREVPASYMELLESDQLQREQINPGREQSTALPPNFI